MKKKYVFAGLALVGLAYFIGTKISNAIQYEFRRIRWRGFSGGRANFELSYSLFNNQDIIVTVNSFRGSLIYGGDYKLAELNLTESVELLPGDLKELSVNIGVPLLKIGSEILRSLDERVGLKRFSVKGILRVTPLNALTVAIPINEQLTLAE